MTDQFPVRAVVVVLGTVVVIAMTGIVWLASTGTAIPDSLDRMGFAALGAIGALLARTSTGNGPAQVEVVNEPEDAVPVEDAEG